MTDRPIIFSGPMLADRPTAVKDAARRRVADRYPGCARAIMSDDPMSNWDRGELVKREVATIEKEAGA